MASPGVGTFDDYLHAMELSIIGLTRDEDGQSDEDVYDDVSTDEGCQAFLHKIESVDLAYTLYAAAFKDVAAENCPMTGTAFAEIETLQKMTFRLSDAVNIQLDKLKRRSDAPEVLRRLCRFFEKIYSESDEVLICIRAASRTAPSSSRRRFYNLVELGGRTRRIGNDIWWILEALDPDGKIRAEINEDGKASGEFVQE